MNSVEFIQKFWSREIQERILKGCEKWMTEHPTKEKRRTETSKASGTMLNGVPIEKCSKLI